MKITIEIPDDCYGNYLDDDDNLIVQEPPIGDKAKREKLLDRFFDEWEIFRIDMAVLIANTLLDITPGYATSRMKKAKERHQSICKKHLNKCLDL